MKNFYEWLLSLNETVTFEISDLEEERMELDLHSLCRKLFYKIEEKFPKEFKEARTKAGKFQEDIITADGDYYGYGKEIINVYTGLFPEESRLKILKAVLYFLPEFGIHPNGEMKKDTSNIMKGIEVYRMPVKVKKNENPAQQLNMSNRNARQLFKMLKIDLEDENLLGSISVAELNMKLNQVTDFDINMAIIPTVQDQGRSGSVDVGLTEDQIKGYLKNLEEMVAWAFKNNYDTISFG